MRLSVVIPTRHRPSETDNILRSLARQSRKPDKVIVVDGSEPDQRYPHIVLAHAKDLNIQYLEHLPPSAAEQRNAGCREALDTSGLIAFFDDDIELPPDTLLNACSSIEKLPKTFVGFALNTTEYSVDHNAIKSSVLAERLGFYSKRPSTVSASGWHSRQSRVEDLLEVDWISSCAVIWRADILRSIQFDDFFEKYSYLEDLEISLQARHLGGRLAILPNANFTHNPSPGGRGSRFWFGRIEIKNRLYIVRKHGLSSSRFWLGATIRAAMTAGSVLHGQWREAGRLAGNITEAFSAFITSAKGLLHRLYRNI